MSEASTVSPETTRVLQSLQVDLASEDSSTQIPALERAAAAVTELATAAVSALERGPNRFLIAERLWAFGASVVPGLRTILTTSEHGEAKILAALVLLRLGDRSGIAILLSAIDESAEYCGLCARHLAQAKVGEAVTPILTRLENIPLGESDTIVCLIQALHTLNQALPPKLLRKFTEEGVSWQVRAAL